MFITAVTVHYGHCVVLVLSFVVLTDSSSKPINTGINMFPFEIRFHPEYKCLKKQNHTLSG